MKHLTIFTISLSVLLLASCTVSTNYYYQLYDIDTDQECVRDSTKLIFEDDNCKIIYNFWSQGGNPGFLFFNKTNTPIYLNKEETFFIFNDIANDYYQNRIYTSSTSTITSSSLVTGSTKYVSGLNNLGLKQTNSGSSSNSLGLSSNTGYSVSFQEPKTICIPPLSAKVFEEYSILKTPHRDCELFRFPEENELSSKEYTAQTSPIRFSNVITYKLGKDGQVINLNNNFYISRIENIPEKGMMKFTHPSHCDEKRTSYIRSMTNISAYRFYTKYQKPSSYTYYKH
jgi:hypothetical protein